MGTRLHETYMTRNKANRRQTKNKGVVGPMRHEARK